MFSSNMPWILYFSLFHRQYDHYVLCTTKISQTLRGARYSRKNVEQELHSHKKNEEM